jgi:hypothetical protein
MPNTENALPVSQLLLCILDLLYSEDESRIFLKNVGTLVSTYQTTQHYTPQDKHS